MQILDVHDNTEKMDEAMTSMDRGMENATMSDHFSIFGLHIALVLCLLLKFIFFKPKMQYGKKYAIL
jgi:hypothetical protein